MMNPWIPLAARLPAVGAPVRLLLRDADGEFESRWRAAMQADGEFYNMQADPSVLVEPTVIAWRRITLTRPRPDWRDFAHTVDGEGGG